MVTTYHYPDGRRFRVAAVHDTRVRISMLDPHALSALVEDDCVETSSRPAAAFKLLKSTSEPMCFRRHRLVVADGASARSSCSTTSSAGSSREGRMISA